MSFSEFCVENINLVVILPFLICLILAGNALTMSRIEKKPLFVLSCICGIVCFVISLFSLFYALETNLAVESSFLWLSNDNINFYLGTLTDKVSAGFLCIATLLNILVQVLCWNKIKENYFYNRMLFYQNLFIFGLSGVFLAQNLLQTYIFCEVIGVASYLLINFDFSNKVESRAAIKSFIFNRIGDLALLFCVLTILYFSVTYNQLWNSTNLAFSNMTQIANSINSLMSDEIFVSFCSVLIFVIIMKFMQAFIYLTFVSKLNTPESKVILFQNSFIFLAGVFLLLRFNPFFVNLGANWVWTVLVVVGLFLFIGIMNKIFIPVCRGFAWIEKYVVDTFLNMVELLVRFLSFLCCRFQSGNFQSYLLYSFLGLLILMVFVIVFLITIYNIGV